MRYAPCAALNSKPLQRPPKLGPSPSPMQVGARLHFELDTSSASSPSVVIQYLESHDGMGTAHVDCSAELMNVQLIHLTQGMP